MNATPSRSTVRPLRRVGAALLVTLLAVSGAWATTGTPTAQAAPGDSLTWGVKESFRNYVTGPIAEGEITLAGGATDNGDGTYDFPIDDVTAAADGDLDVAFDGSIQFTGHAMGEPPAPALNLTIAELRIEATGDDGVLVADVVSKAMDDPTLVTYDDVELAELDFTGNDPTSAGGALTWTSVPAALAAAGAEAFAGFYPAGTGFDPLTFTVTPPPTWTPQIQLSKANDIDPMGETITVTGSGFDPGVNISTRPPVPVGMPTGVYVIFGRFADVWKPSAGAPPGARTVLDQMWPLPAASKAAAEAAFGPNPQYVVLDADGSFELTLDVSRVAGAGNFGVYTYAAGGAAPNAAQETFTPITFAPPFTDVLPGHPFFEEISWLAFEEIAGGYPDGSFQPGVVVTRQAMAAFLYRLAGEPAVPPGAPTFTDVPSNHPFFDEISWLAAEGITTGFPDGSFKPGTVVTRQATAAFLHRTAGEPAVPPGAPTFTDVSSGHPFFDEISWLAAVEVTTGYLDGTFRPGDDVTRQATAAFLQRFDGLPA